MTFPKLDRYELRRGLGRGAMGSVYLAHDEKMHREVAVKVLASEFAGSAKHRTRFDREAKAIAALRHPNIVDIYDYGGSPDQYLYLVMEYVEGPHIGKVVRDHGPMPEAVIAAAGAELAAALHHAHQNGVIHRDLKPENVFLDKGRLVLADFGIVKAIADDNPFGRDAASPKTDVIGTPGFMAPEQLEQKPLTERADIFAFGALLYFTATQKLPYDADSPYALLKEFRETRPKPLADARHDISDALSALVQSCLEVNPEYRPTDIETVRRQLRGMLDDIGAGDVREVLKRYETSPEGYRAFDRERTLKHLIEQLKIAVRDEDGVRADEIRRRISRLDPGNAEALRITGTDELIADQPRETAPEVVLARSSRRSTALWAVALLIAAAAVAAVVVNHYWPKPPVVEEPLQVMGLLQVRAKERTHVFLEGRPLGTAPGFPPAAIPSGTVTLELVSDKHGRMEQLVEVGPEGKTVVVIDWKKRKVKVRQGKGGAVP